MSIAIVGPRGTGKHLVYGLLDEAEIPGPIRFQSAPLVSRLKRADRYVVTSRALAAESLLRRRRALDGGPSTVTLGACRDEIDEGRRQVESHVAGADVHRVDYRDAVERTDDVVAGLADWLGVPPWRPTVKIIDGDAGLTAGG